MSQASRIFKIFAVGLVLLFILFPIYWLLITSFKQRLEVLTKVSFWPEEPTFYNYYRPFFEDVYAKNVLNSFLVALGEVALCVPPALLAAYAFSRLKFKGDNHLLFWLLTNRMAPAAAFLIPYFSMYTFLKLYDTLIGLILINSIANLPFAVWLLKGFIDGIPKEIEEAALIDGYTFWGLLRRILLPLLTPGLVTASFFIFIFAWNEMLFASMLAASGGAAPLTHALLHYLSELWVNWGEIAAITLLAMVPALVFAYVIQRYIVRGLTFGAVR